MEKIIGSKTNAKRIAWYLLQYNTICIWDYWRFIKYFDILFAFAFAVAFCLVRCSIEQIKFLIYWQSEITCSPELVIITANWWKKNWLLRSLPRVLTHNRYGIVELFDSNHLHQLKCNHNDISIPTSDIHVATAPIAVQPFSRFNWIYALKRGICVWCEPKANKKMNVHAYTCAKQKPAEQTSTICRFKWVWITWILRQINETEYVCMCMWWFARMPSVQTLVKNGD